MKHSIKPVSASAERKILIPKLSVPLMAVIGLAFLPADGLQAASVKADFNGDGYADLAVGVPLEDFAAVAKGAGTRTNAGAVNVIYGSSAGLTATNTNVPTAQFWSQDSPGILDAAESGDRFGDAIATGDFNRDGYADLAIAVPCEATTVSAMQLTRGAIQILYGSASGLTSLNNQFLRSDQIGLTGVGNSLAAGDFNGDGFGDLAVEGGLTDSAVGIIHGSSSGLSLTRRMTLPIQNAADFIDLIEARTVAELSLAAGRLNNDSFDDLVVGTPFARVNGNYLAGAAQVFFGSATGITAIGRQDIDQDKPGVPEVAEDYDQFGTAVTVGDFNGDGIGDLAVGVPFEDNDLQVEGGPFPNRIVDGGLVHIFFGTASGITVAGNQVLNLYSTGGSFGDRDVETGDNFGSALAAGGFNEDRFQDLAIGAPGETIGDAVRAGSVSVYYGSATGLATSQFWTEPFPDSDDNFGACLTACNFGRKHWTGIPLRIVDTDDLAIGIPGYDFAPGGGEAGIYIDSGAVRVIYGSTGGLSTASGAIGLVGPSQLWTQPSGSRAGNEFGSVLP